MVECIMEFHDVFFLFLSVRSFIRAAEILDDYKGME